MELGNKLKYLILSMEDDVNLFARTKNEKARKRVKGTLVSIRETAKMINDIVKDKCHVRRPSHLSSQELSAFFQKYKDKQKALRAKIRENRGINNG